MRVWHEPVIVINLILCVWVPSRKENLTSHSYKLTTFQGSPSQMQDPPWLLPNFHHHLWPLSIHVLAALDTEFPSPSWQVFFRPFCHWSCCFLSLCPLSLLYPTKSCAPPRPAHVSLALWELCWLPSTPSTPSKNGPVPVSIIPCVHLSNKGLVHHILIGWVLLASLVLWDPEEQGYILSTWYSLRVVLFYCCVTNYQKSSGLKLYVISQLCGSEVQVGLARFSARSLIRCPSAWALMWRLWRRICF